MKKWIQIITIVGSALGQTTFAETREAVLTKVNFDGTKFSYGLTAYEATDEVKTEVRVDCNFGLWAGNKSQELVLKSIDVRVFISDEFNIPSQNVIREGSADISQKIEQCLKEGNVNPRDISVMPVTVNLPKVSLPVMVKK